MPPDRASTNRGTCRSRDTRSSPTVRGGCAFLVTTTSMHSNTMPVWRSRRSQRNSSGWIASTSNFSSALLGKSLRFAVTIRPAPDRTAAAKTWRSLGSLTIDEISSRYPPENSSANGNAVRMRRTRRFACSGVFPNLEPVRFRSTSSSRSGVHTGTKSSASASVSKRLLSVCGSITQASRTTRNPTISDAGQRVLVKPSPASSGSGSSSRAISRSTRPRRSRSRS